MHCGILFNIASYDYMGSLKAYVRVINKAERCFVSSVKFC